MRLFFSWQSDIPENKKTIRKILQKICNNLDIEYTEDTRGEAGGDHVVDVLLRKIKNSDIFVGDITIVGSAVNGDSVSNSNVCYELGYAEAVLGRSQIIMIMNEEYGTFDDMPFDLGKRMITRYKSVADKLSEAESISLSNELRKKIENLAKSKDVVLKIEEYDIYAKTLLYWCKHKGDGILHGKLDYGNFVDNNRILSVGDSFIEENEAFFYTSFDIKLRALFTRGLNKLEANGLLFQATRAHPKSIDNEDSWVLTPEGDVVASAILVNEVLKLHVRVD